MWGKKKSVPKQVSNGRFDTLISNKTQITGSIQFSGGLHIDGKVTGSIRATDDSDAVVRISDLGIVEGDVVAPHVVVNGRVNGDVYSTKHIELAAKASILGNVYYNLIEMTMGAEVNGNLVHKKDVQIQTKAAKTGEKPAPEQATEKLPERKKPVSSEEGGAMVVGLGNTKVGKL